MKNKGKWIIDTGASRHMFIESHMMHNVRLVTNKVTVCLPDGNTVQMNYVGEVFLTSDIVLKDVL